MLNKHDHICDSQTFRSSRGQGGYRVRSATEGTVRLREWGWGKNLGKAEVLDPRLVLQPVVQQQPCANDLQSQTRPHVKTSWQTERTKVTLRKETLVTYSCHRFWEDLAMRTPFYVKSHTKITTIYTSAINTIPISLSKREKKTLCCGEICTKRSFPKCHRTIV